MCGAPVLMVVAPLGVTIWVVTVATAVVLALLAIVVARHLEVIPRGEGILEQPVELVAPLTR